MARYTCQLVYPTSNPSIWDIAAAFGREGDHLATDDLEKVMAHKHEVERGDERLRQFHVLFVDGGEEGRLVRVDLTSLEGTTSNPEKKR